MESEPRQQGPTDGSQRQRFKNRLRWKHCRHGNVAISCRNRSRSNFQIAWPENMLACFSSACDFTLGACCPGDQQRVQLWHSLLFNINKSLFSFCAQVVALVDVDGTGKNVSNVTLLSGFNSPNGVAWHDGTLYVAEISRITAYANADATTSLLQVRALGPLNVFIHKKAVFTRVNGGNTSSAATDQCPAAAASLRSTAAAPTYLGAQSSLADC